MYAVTGAASVAEDGEKFAAFDTNETSHSTTQIDNMADLTISGATLAFDIILCAAVAVLGKKYLGGLAPRHLGRQQILNI